MGLQAPFPWFGGKARVAAEVWDRFGSVANYVEPFFGSGAVLLSRPGGALGTETVNDKDRFVANFWRAMRANPEAVAHHADWPVNEVDLTARHLWLLGEGAAKIARCDGDPEFYDAQVAGRWVWGLCSWIGGGWCSGEGPWQWDQNAHQWIERNAGRGINRQLPHLWRRRGINRELPLSDWFASLSDRLRRVRVCSGDWSRVCGDFVTWRYGVTAVFLDPPYADTAGRVDRIYATDSLSVAHDVREWAIEAGRNPLMRIALCGYDGEHAMPADWDAYRWKAHGGYAHLGTGDGRVNANRETIWFSPHCISPRQGGLFD